MPVPFLSVITNDCIARGRDYNAGGARYNTSYIQGVGIGTITDSLAAIKKYVYERGDVTLEESIKLFGEGTELSKLCYETLQTAEQKITELSKLGETEA